MIVVVDVAVKFFYQFFNTNKAVKVTKLFFKPTKERLLVAILPRRAGIGNRN
jgi:hypothetical protein